MPAPSSPIRPAGFSLLELLLALVLFGVGALAAARALGVAFHLTGTAVHQAEAARLATTSASGLVRQARGGSAPCGALAVAPLAGAGGVSAAAAMRPVAGGVELSVELRYTGPAGPRTDTLWSFLPCR